MANLLIAGFEKDDITSVAREWAFSTVSGAAISAMGGRRSTPCIRITSGSVAMAHRVSAGTTCHVGFAFKIEGVPDNNCSLLYMGNFASAVNPFILRVLRTRVLQIVSASGSGTEGTPWTGTTILLDNTWYYIEVSCVLHASTGTMAAYINGSSTPDNTVITGNTIGTGGGVTIDAIAFGGPSSGVTAVSYGDVYANSGSGAISKDNTRWGDTKVVGYLPNAAGNSNTLTSITTGTAASTNYQEVDDATTDDDSTYVYGTSGGDTYNFPALGFTPSTIQSVCVRITGKKTDAGTRTLNCTTRSTGDAGSPAIADTDGTAVSLGTSYSVTPFLWPQNPNGNTTWTQTTYEAAEFGPKVA